MKTFNHTLGKLASFGPTITRVILGVLVFWHGIDKFRTGLGAVGDQFDMWGAPLPDLSAIVVSVLEVGLGIALVVGFATRISAAVMTIVLVGALFFVKLDGSLLGGSETDFAYIAGLAGLVLTGPGRLSVDEAMHTDETILDLRDADMGRRINV